MFRKEDIEANITPFIAALHSISHSKTDLSIADFHENVMEAPPEQVVQVGIPHKPVSAIIIVKKKRGR